jgi:uncharacterized membrane protein YfcA
MDGLQVTAGALTGFVVGMTGVGGGALMTPLLLLVFGTAPLTAVGTDLWFAALTKIAVSSLHVRQDLIDWAIVRRLWTGSLPASGLTLVALAAWPVSGATLTLVRLAIAVAVCVTAVGLLADRWLRGRAGASDPDTDPGAAVRPPQSETPTFAAGVGLGALVTLTSVGAGALGVVFLAHRYRDRLTPQRLVATDIAHAIPLALCAGLGHLASSHVDLTLLRDLLAGSIPAAFLGAVVSTRVPHAMLRAVLGVALLVVGLAMLRNAASLH